MATSTPVVRVQNIHKYFATMFAGHLFYVTTSVVCIMTTTLLALYELSGRADRRSLR
jgi:hypothetical protein